MLQGRIFSYGDTHRYRLGVNHQQIPVNRPKAGIHNMQRDGYMTVNGNDGGKPNYEPNSLNGPIEDRNQNMTPFELNGEADSVAYNSDDHYTQAGDLYRLMSKDERERLVKNFADHMRPVQRDEIKLRQIGHFYKADPEWGERVAEQLGLSVPAGVK